MSPVERLAYWRERAGTAEDAERGWRASSHNFEGRLKDAEGRLDAAEIALRRAGGALVDAETVPTDDVERGIRHLTAERDAFRNAMGWWKAEALLIALGHGTGTVDSLLIAAVVPVPIPRDVVLEHMEEAKRAIVTWEQRRKASGP
jgi:hypothetical protein